MCNKKNYLWNRIEEFLDIPIEDNLISSLKNGYILCQLVYKIQPLLLKQLGERKFPKNEKNINLFQAMEHLNW